MIVSSLGSALPAAVVNGVFGTTLNNYFSDLWNAAAGTVPNDTAWTGWTGDPADVIVQRIDLTPLFFPVQLVTGKTNSGYGYYTVDNLQPPVFAGTAGTTNYYIQGSVLSLNEASSTNRLILNSPGGFVFDNGVWRSNGNGSGAGPGVMDLGAVVQQFLAATPNVNAANPNGNAQQVLIVNDMLNYMQTYNAWAASGYTDAGLKSQATTIQGQMMTDIDGIYNGSPSGANFPQTSPCP
jgi:hypothetical protein